MRAVYAHLLWLNPGQGGESCPRQSLLSLPTIGLLTTLSTFGLWAIPLSLPTISKLSHHMNANVKSLLTTIDMF